MKVLCVLLALMLRDAEGMAGGAAGLCMVALCILTCVGPAAPGCLACVAACISFDPSNEVHVCLADQADKFQAQRLESVHPGQSVVTSLANGTKTCTKVQENKLYYSSSPFRKIHFRDATEDDKLLPDPLMITDFHDVIVQHRGSRTAIMYNDSMEIIQARDVMPGDRLLSDGKHFIEVSEVIKYRSTEKMHFITEECTAEIGGVLVPTACLDPKKLGFDTDDDDDDLDFLNKYSRIMRGKMPPRDPSLDMKQSGGQVSTVTGDHAVYAIEGTPPSEAQAVTTNRSSCNLPAPGGAMTQSTPAGKSFSVTARSAMAAMS